MAMSEEKKMILKMLEEGKITSEEAIKLIEAIEENKTNKTDFTFNKKDSESSKATKNFHDELSKMRDKLNNWKKEFKSNYSQKDFDKMVDEFSVKAEKMGKNLAATTSNIVDKMVDYVGSVVDTNSFNTFSNCKVVEKTFEANFVDNANLTITGINGNILLKKHSADTITINSRIKSPMENLDSILILEEIDNVISLKINNPNNTNLSISHEVSIPDKKFSKINLITNHGKIYAEDAYSDIFECNTKNNNIELTGINSDDILVSTRNAKIQLNLIAGKKSALIQTNSLIDVKRVKTEIITAITENARINIENVQNYNDSNQINMNLRSKNGNIKIDMEDVEDMGYKINAQTTLNGINLLIPDLKYNKIDKSSYHGNVVEAYTTNYETTSKTVNINAETQNGYIEIVK